MSPVKKDVTIRFGDSHQIFFRVRERVWSELEDKFVPGPYRDLTGWTVLAQIRATTDSEVVLLTYTPTLGNQADEVLGRGSIWLDITPTQTNQVRAMNPQPTGGVYDVQLTTPAGEVYTYLEGKINFAKDVSRV